MIYADIQHSKDLKDLFPKPDFWHVYYARGTAKGHVQYKEFLKWYIMGSIPSDYEEILPCLSTDMLLEILPDRLRIERAVGIWHIKHDIPGQVIPEIFMAEKLPNALCKLVKFLRDNELLEVENGSV